VLSMPGLPAWLELIGVKAFPVRGLQNRPILHHYRYIHGAEQHHDGQIRGSRDFSENRDRSVQTTAVANPVDWFCQIHLNWT